MKVITPQQLTHAILCQSLKEAVKADYPRQRALNASSKEAQRKGDNVPRSEFYVQRQKARARLLVYGFVRGREWKHMEPNHPEGVASMAWSLRRAWDESVKAITTDEKVVQYIEVPAALKKYL